MHAYAKSLVERSTPHHANQKHGTTVNLAPGLIELIQEQHNWRSITYCLKTGTEFCRRVARSQIRDEKPDRMGRTPSGKSDVARACMQKSLLESSTPHHADQHHGKKSVEDVSILKRYNVDESGRAIVESLPYWVLEPTQYRKATTGSHHCPYCENSATNSLR